MNTGVLELDEPGFDDVTTSNAIPLVVDFWAPWCGPCRATAPVFAQVAEEFRGRATFGSVNVDNGQVLAQRFGVRAIPTILVIQAGRVVATAVGTQSAEDLRRMVASVL